MEQDQGQLAGLSSFLEAQAAPPPLLHLLEDPPLCQATAPPSIFKASSIVPSNLSPVVTAPTLI